MKIRTCPACGKNARKTKKSRNYYYCTNKQCDAHFAFTFTQEVYETEYGTTLIDVDSDQLCHISFIMNDVRFDLSRNSSNVYLLLSDGNYLEKPIGNRLLTVPEAIAKYNTLKYFF